MSKIKIYDSTLLLYISKSDVEDFRNGKNIYDYHTKVWLQRAAIIKYPWLESKQIVDVSVEWFDKDELMFQIMFKEYEDGKTFLDMEKTSGWKTKKSYQEMALEIIETVPNKWWSIGDVADEALSLSYFDVEVMGRSKIQRGFYGALMNIKSKFEHKKGKHLTTR